MPMITPIITDPCSSFGAIYSSPITPTSPDKVDVLLLPWTKSCHVQCLRTVDVPYLHLTEIFSNNFFPI